ncbi:MAG: hypothetical protein ACD_11C00018G0002 [uncultured bacterium]|nr:MAG: hypothetical protein ACD_11C00018G0002 [uncultured bacterium]HBR71528.1 hypothetical protein [Candidatus Moranbacteria bacterium]
MRIVLKNIEIEYELKKSKRARQMRLVVDYFGKISVTIPWRLNEKTAEDFLIKKSDWILERKEYFSKFKDKTFIKTSRKDYLKHKETARKIITERVKYFNGFYNFKFNRINIKNQKTLWGSCSQGGNLNFNYILALVSAEIVDYIVVHELCHLWEFNHSKEFWRLVGLTIPDHKEKRKLVKNIHF